MKYLSYLPFAIKGSPSLLDGAELHSRAGNCTLFKTTNPKNTVWQMFSPLTGQHSITTLCDYYNDRVHAHWKGFIANQTR